MAALHGERRVILGIIPARGGSKGIPRKNVRALCGRPLIAWTIEAARASRLLNRCVVSTEDPEIGDVARQYGAEVLCRPAELAGDEVPTLRVLQHALGELPGETVVVLQPTSPIRDGDLIDRCIRRFRDDDLDSLATGFICKYREYGTSSAPRQNIAGFFYDDGNVYVIRADLVKRGDRFGTRMGRMLTDREQNVEIDDEFDFWLAEQVMRRRCDRGQ